MANSKRILVSWIGTTDLLSMASCASQTVQKKVLAACQRDRPLTGRGPIKTLVESIAFDEVHLLCNYSDHVGRDYVKWLGHGSTLREIELTNPTDYPPIFTAVDSFLAELITKPSQLCIHLSPGTPAMTAIWVLLGKSKYPATFYQTYGDKYSETEIPFDLVVDFVPELIRDADRTLQHLSERSPQQIRGFDQIIGNSKAIRLAVGRAAKAAIRDVPVLIQGDSGTGKEMFARAIHQGSHRASGPFVAINCAAIPRELLESELFGHKKGAFTSADANHEGAFEQADGGTLFLDEIGECESAMQAKLLRALQSPPGKGPCHRVFRRVGESKDRISDVRVLAATNRDLIKRIQEHAFREDLYYRLAVITIKLPPLCERSTDISLLADELLKQINSEFAIQEPGYKPKSLSDDAQSFIRKFPWPGNVRQLYNALTQAAVMTDRDILRKGDIVAAVPEIPIAPTDVMERPLGDGFNLSEHLDSIHRHYIQRALEASGGIKSKARKLLGVPSDQTFSAQLKRLNLWD
ncbi:MAG: sigma 54-interacting transcriptional regulator [Pirellulaceae bacterium]|nr:sigma 54-interacting transcriptional regulator [Pirellulaceae bacterium]